jgi:hypothetical protein
MTAPSRLPTARDPALWWFGLGLALAALVAAPVVLEWVLAGSAPPREGERPTLTLRARQAVTVPLLVDALHPSLRWPEGFDGLRRTREVHLDRGQVLAAAGERLTRLGAHAASEAERLAPRPSLPALLVTVAFLAGVFLLLAGALPSCLPPEARTRRGEALVLVLPAVLGLGTAALVLLTDLPAVTAPVALPAVLAGLALGRRAAVAVAATSLAVVGLSDLVVGPAWWTLAGGSLAAALAVVRRQPLTCLAAAAAAGLVQGLVALALPAPPPPLGVDAPALLPPLWAAAAGTAAGLAGLVLAGPWSWISGVASARRLRRATSLRSPLVQELRRRAPGTDVHGLNVAFLAEAGGRALRADVLLLAAAGRVHDLGKLLRPDLHAENLPPGEPDPLDALPAAEAAALLRRHVSDGVQLARRYRLPRELVELLAAHHGTTPVRGPLRRALREGEDPDPEGFHYPGPLPRSREAAVLLVADAVEGASRRLGDPTLAAVGAVVGTVVDRLASEYQFEACPVSQAELVALEEAMTLALRHALHRRPAPPKAPEAPEAPARLRTAEQE